MFLSAISPAAVTVIALAALGSVQAMFLAPFDSNYTTDKNITAQQVEIIAPLTASCTTPASIYPENECTNSSRVAKGINESNKIWGIKSLGTMSAIVSLLTHESDSYRANINHNPAPGFPGQGTKAMLPFNNLFRFVVGVGFTQEVSEMICQDANALLELDDATVNSELTAMSDDVKNTVRELVLGDDYTFQAAAWYLNQRCSSEIYRGLMMNGYEGYKAYIEDPTCIGVTIDDSRKARWCLAVKALKPAKMALPAECLS